MATKLHHLNFCSNAVPDMARFYREILDLSSIPDRAQQRVTDQGYGAEVAFVTDGTTEIHLATKDLNVGFRMGQAINQSRGVTSLFAPITLTRLESG